MALPSLNTQIETMGDLKKAISLWSNRDDPEFLDQCHNFINFAEKDIYRRLRIPSLQREIYLNIVDGIAHVPTDLVEVKYVFNRKTGDVFRVTSPEEIQWIKQNK
ncbi:phage adaptor protein, partial [Herbiconiux daphne]